MVYACLHGELGEVSGACQPASHSVCFECSLSGGSEQATFIEAQELVALCDARIRNFNIWFCSQQITYCDRHRRAGLGYINRMAKTYWPASIFCFLLGHPWHHPGSYPYTNTGCAASAFRPLWPQGLAGHVLDIVFIHLRPKGLSATDIRND